MGEVSLRLRHVMETAIAAKIVPGAVILGASGGKTRFQQAFGARQLQPDTRIATAQTIYDIASLTKAVSTSVLMMRAVADGLLALDDPLERHLPEFLGDGKKAVTLRHLLCHASGLPAHRPFYDTCKQDIAAEGTSPSGVISRAAAAEPLLNAPGTVSVYSDLGFILLGALLERVTGVELDALWRRTIAVPLGLKSTTFVNLAGIKARQALLEGWEVAPTEDCAVRGRMTLGEVHDLNAFAMGGIAGHAGLFSDTHDLGTIAAALVAAWQGVPATSSGYSRAPGNQERRSLVDREVIQEFWRPAGIAGSTWRLGWDGPASHQSQAGSLISRQAVGHLGFTGCSLWIDPQRALWIVLLTNRVHPTVRDDPRFRVFRANVQDAAVDALLAPTIPP